LKESGALDQQIEQQVAKVTAQAARHGAEGQAE
jgi:hypothetical protein